MPKVCRFLPLLALLAVGCVKPDVVPPKPIPIPNGTCEMAEARLEELRCVQDGVELWDGFAEACRIDASHGIDDHPACIAGLASCDQADDAWRNGCGQ